MHFTSSMRRHASQIVLEGYDVEPGARRREGPFGDHTGLYSQPDDYPVFHLTCVTRRERPTYLTTIVGVPPMEDYYLGLASERIFLPIIRKTLPEIVDMHFPAEGIFHNLVIVSIDKRFPGHARKIMNAFWGLGQLMFSKTIIVVEKDVNVQDVREVTWIVGTHMDPLRDVQMTRGPVDDLDDAAKRVLRQTDVLQSHTVVTAAQEIAAIVLATALLAREHAPAATGEVPAWRVKFGVVLAVG